jgi:hypothetical protein
MDEAAIHRISRGCVRLVSSVCGSQLIATGIRPRDDKIDRHSRFRNKRF